MNIKRIGLIGGGGVPVGGSSGTGSSTTVVDNLESLSKSAALSANMGRELNETKAPKVGYAPDLKVSYAEELVGRGESTPEVIGAIRPTSGEESSIKDGNATIERIIGESVVWNQLASGTTGTIESNGITLVSSWDEKGLKIVANGTALDIVRCIVYTLKTPRLPHKYAIQGCPMGGGDTTYNISGIYVFTAASGNADVGNGVIIDGNKQIAYIDSICCTICANTTVENLEFRPCIYDLTLMFGAGNEPTTIEEFEARKPLGVSNEYNKGTIVSFQGGDVKTVGFNAWDEEWEVGGFYKGNKETAEGYNNTIRSRNHIPVIPKAVYKFTTPQTLYINYFDINKQYLSAVRIYPNTEFTIPENVHYLWHRSFENTYGTTYKNDICIHLVHSGYRNGDYEPYVDDVHPLPNIKKIKDNNGDVLFPYGLLSAGSVHDEITATKAIKRIGVVDMGSLSWTYVAENNHERFTSIFANGVGVESNQVANIITNIYNIVSNNDTYYKTYDNSISLRDNQIQVCDSYYTSAADFTAAMQGVLLYYELAEPIEVDLPEPLNMTYEAWDFGTEELIHKGATTPLNADIVYLFNAVDRIRENSTKNTKLEARIKILEDTIALLTTQTPDEGETANE